MKKFPSLATIGFHTAENGPSKVEGRCFLIKFNRQASAEVLDDLTVMTQENQALHGEIAQWQAKATSLNQVRRPLPLPSLPVPSPCSGILLLVRAGEKVGPSWNADAGLVRR